MEEEKKYYTVKEFAAKNRLKGSWPNSESAIWALKANSSENGFNKVFIHVGRRVLIDEEKFYKAMESMPN